MTQFGPEREEIPELVTLSRDALLVQSWETFAMAELGPERRNLELVVFSGRWNKTEETGTFTVLIIEEELPLLIEGLQKGLASMREAKA